MSKYSVPTHLEHKPIFVIRDYNEVDGYYPAESTDAQHLSLGQSQWSREELSLKVWRHSGNRWSRQSEELPLHRAIDLVSLLCVAMEKLELRNLQAGHPIKMGNENKEVDVMPEGWGVLDIARSFLMDHDDLLKGRLRALSKSLEDLKAAGLL